MPYWRNKSNYSHEEVSDLLKQVYNHLVPSIMQLENENLIDSHVGTSICHWLTLIHDNLPCQFCHADWHNTIARSAPEVCPSHVLHQLSPNAPLPAKKASPAIPARQVALSSTAAPPVPPRSTHPPWTPMSLISPVAHSLEVSPSPRNHPHIHSLATVLSHPNMPPSPLTSCQAPPIWTSFAPVRPLGLYHPPPTGVTTNLSPPCPPLVTPDQVISCGFREMASAFQGLCQALLSPGASALVSGSGAASSAVPNITTTSPSPPGNTVLPEDKVNLVESSLRSMRRQLQHDSKHHNAPLLPLVTGQGEFLGAHPLSPMREEAPAPMTWPPPLPVEELLSTVIEELPSPPQAYHPMTGAPLHSRSLVVLSSAPDAPVPEPSKAPSPKCGGQSNLKGAKSKAKGKSKAIVPIPEPACTPTLPPTPQTSAIREEPPLPKKSLKRKHPVTESTPPESGPSTQVEGSRSTRARSATSKAACLPEAPSDAESKRAGPSVKKPHFSPEKVARRQVLNPMQAAASNTDQESSRMFYGRPKQQFLAAEFTQVQDPEVAGVPIDRHNSHVELENYHFEDLITAPDEFFDPIRYGNKNGTYGAHSSRYAFYAHAPDHYEKTCLPCSARMIECTWNNWFPGATCNQCQDGHHRGCSARYTACEMHEITSHLTTFMRYNIPSLHRNIMQLCSINCELEHIHYLYRSRVRARDHVVRDIVETLDQFASAEGGNELIEALSGAYHEVRSFIVDDGLRRSAGQSLNLPQGPEYIPSDNNTSMWNEGEDDAGEVDGEQAAGPSGTQGGDSSGAAGSSK
ncbi:hypothetical protein EV421DRAFT_1914271 [Armillaria borealis]|uniref:Uncharacterized protein n=1 Tax=Armillaria borealis TaxID=47425 RepID=A0AA39IVD4_9AGAR|nr:hypothetical protein EV421DRAFT_1914271 [Armillaria borealis]